MGKELPELPVQLRGERLVMCQHHGGALHALDYRGRAVGFPRPRHSEQRLVREPLGEPFDELLDRLGLIARGGVIGFELEGLLFHADGFPMAGPDTIS